MNDKVKCLLVDDLEENLLVLSALLRSDDLELLTARSGVEALDLLLEHDVALALVDVQMPDMDGFELAELMRGAERTRNIPLIFVTAGTRDQHRLFKGYDSGAVDFLYKPIEPVILRNKAAVFFQLYRQKQQIERELRERTEALRMNEMFAAVLGHDLRSPLSAILTAARVLERVSTDAAVHQAAARITSSGGRMNRLIEDMLDMARVRLGGGLPIAPSDADLEAAVRRAIDEQGGDAVKAPIDCDVSGNARGRWDADRIAQLVSNLLGNAIEHGAGGRIAVRIDGTQPERVKLSVTNAGAIGAAMLDGIFDPFSTGRREHGRGQGLGLGLYIARQIVEAHGGTIAVSVGGDCTTFAVELPRGTQ